MEQHTSGCTRCGKAADPLAGFGDLFESGMRAGRTLLNVALATGRESIDPLRRSLGAVTVTFVG